MAVAVRDPLEMGRKVCTPPSGENQIIVTFQEPEGLIIFRRKKSSKSSHSQQGDEERSPMSQSQSQLFLPELITKLESEESVESEETGEIGLLKPSQIKRFVSNQPRSSQ